LLAWPDHPARSWEPKRLRLWASLFAEAALNSRVVAIWLGEAKPVKPPRDYADSAQWLNNSIYGVVLRGSLYLQYLAIALHESDKDSRDKSAILRLVSALPLLRRRERLLYEWRGLPGAMLLLALVASGVVLHDRTPPPDWLLALSMTYLFGVVYVFHNRRVRLIRVWYSIALNLIAVVERGPDHRQMMRSRWWMAFARRGVPLPSSYRRLRGAITEILRLRGVPYSEGDGQRQ
ncbi:MAG: hypothetical protein NTU88_08420, partial [Armatimonadetes bacterium]|nr:hypothetical protein [Armatimonadota bacterium]